VLVADFSGRSAGGDQAELQSAGGGSEADEHRSGIISISRRIQTNARQIVSAAGVQITRWQDRSRRDRAVSLSGMLVSPCGVGSNTNN
jgi:hypothetical protein